MAELPVWDDTLHALGQEAWLVATTAQKEFALREATAVIDGLPFKGLKANPSQSLSWPRLGVRRDDGSLVTGVPVQVQQATSALAGFFLAQGEVTSTGLAQALGMIAHLLED